MSETTSGRLIVFEGPDGVGKSDLARRCSEYLVAQGQRCHLLTFPGRENGTLGKLVYDIHHAPQAFGVEGLSPASLQVLHIAAHIDAVQRRILPSLRAGDTIVLDRFWWSTLVYGKVAGADAGLLKRMVDLELTVWGAVQPSMLFLVHRRAPLRSEPIEQWQGWTTEYAKLVASESRIYPITEICNESTVKAAMDAVLAALNATSNPPPATKSAAAPVVFSSLAPAKPTVVYDTYWRFAVERQRIFHKRARCESPPWTADPILQVHKFTNAYRASDRVSQYLIRNVIYRGDQSPEEMFFRIILFKLFNRIETWELLCQALGEIRFSEFKFARYDAILTKAIERGTRIYSAAYIMPSGGKTFGHDRKHRTHLRLIQSMMKDGLPHRLCDAPSMGQAFELLRSYPTIGDFLAYQYVTDVNYSTITNFSEMEFVVPGPGARDGIRKCFSDLGGLSEPDIIRVVANRQLVEFDRLGLDFQSLWGRPLQLIDCQNLFCETDKYARVKHPEVQGLTGRTRIKQKFQPKNEPIRFWYPPKWGLNEQIAAGGPRDPGLLWEQR